MHPYHMHGLCVIPMITGIKLAGLIPLSILPQRPQGQPLQLQLTATGISMFLLMDMCLLQAQMLQRTFMQRGLIGQKDMKASLNPIRIIPLTFQV